MTKQIKSFQDLQQLQAAITKLQNPALAARVASRVAPVLTGLAQRAYDARQSPYGVPWGPGKGGDSLDLHETGALRAKALTYTASGPRIRASIMSVRYGRYHIHRGILPRSGQQMPVAWQRVVTDIAREEIGAELAKVSA